MNYTSSSEFNLRIPAFCKENAWHGILIVSETKQKETEEMYLVSSPCLFRQRWRVLAYTGHYLTLADRTGTRATYRRKVLWEKARFTL